MDNLTVDHRERLLKPRKSVIGKLERSSFQAQRLSDVGVAFSQQITAKVGLKLPASQERIVEQTRWLYLRYVFVRLRQNKLPLRDLNLTKSSRARRSEALGLPRLGCLDGTQIVVSVSEPPSADINLDEDDDDYNCDYDYDKLGQIFTRTPRGARQRPATSTQLDSQDLNKLAALMSHASVRRPPPMSTIAAKQHNNNNNNNNNLMNLTSKNNFDHLYLSNGARKCSIKPITKYAADSTTPLQTITPELPSSPSLSLFNNHVPNTASKLVNQTISNCQNGATSTDSAVSGARKFVMDPTINNQIFTVIMNTITELRELKPEFYSDTIYEVIGIDKFSSLESLLEVQKTICQEMTRSEISWDRIIALFSLFGAMSLDCVRLGSPEHVGPILDGFIGFVERDLALWISQQGGWESFLYKCQAGYGYGPMYKALALVAPLIVWAIFFAVR